MRQHTSSAIVHNLAKHVSIVDSLKKNTTMVKNISPQKRESKITVVLFADGCKNDEPGQLGYIAVVLIDNCSQVSIFQVSSWDSSKSKRPVNSIASVEALAIVNYLRSVARVFRMSDLMSRHRSNFYRFRNCRALHKITLS